MVREFGINRGWSCGGAWIWCGPGVLCDPCLFQISLAFSLFHKKSSVVQVRENVLTRRIFIA